MIDLYGQAKAVMDAADSPSDWERVEVAPDAADPHKAYPWVLGRFKGQHDISIRRDQHLLGKLGLMGGQLHRGPSVRTAEEELGGEAKYAGRDVYERFLGRS